MKHPKLQKILLIFTFLIFQIYFFGLHILVLAGKKSEITPAEVLVTYFFVALTFIQLILYTVSLYRANKLKAELAWLKHEKELHQKEQENLTHSQDVLLKQKSDMLEQLKQLQKKLEDESVSTDSACKMASEIQNDFQHNRPRPYCSNSVINAILHSKKEVADRNNISVTYEINVPEEILLPKPILVCIFFNLLDNAIESCIRSGSETPFLKLTVSWQEDMLFLNMINSKSPSESFTGLSSKPDSANHGYGLSIIEEITRKNDGSAQWHDQGDTFRSVVMLHYRQQDLTF